VRATDDIVELVEENAFPRFRNPRCLRRAAQQRGHTVRPLRIRQQCLQPAVPQLDRDARAVAALKDRVQIALPDGEVSAIPDPVEVLLRGGDDELELVRGAVELLEDPGDVRLDVSEISP